MFRLDDAYTNEPIYRVVYRYGGETIYSNIYIELEEIEDIWEEREPDEDGYWYLPYTDAIYKDLDDFKSHLVKEYKPTPDYIDEPGYDDRVER